MAINVSGLIAIIVFYLLIVVVGVYASWRKRNSGVGQKTETIMIAGRQIGLVFGCFTMTATWVGGGYINGTSESVYDPNMGLIWTLAPFGYSLAVLVAGLMFAKKMRSEGYITMLDPLQCKLGRRMGGLLYIPALLAEMFWSASILAALGGTLTVIVGLDVKVAILVSTLIAILYTLLGGLYSVAYTDVVQLVCIFVGLYISIPFVLMHPAVENISTTAYSNKTWLGTWDSSRAGLWFDSAMMLTFGGIPWQAYFQRVLASDSPDHARTVSIVACFGCMIVTIPSIIIGAAAASTDWSMTGYYNVSGGLTPAENNQSPLILSIVLQYLTPGVVSFLGLGAISAAVMSSTDSSMLASSSMLTRNVYRNVFRQNASETEMLWVLRIAIVVLGGLSALLAIAIKSVYVLWYLCSDLVYVILFPQLLGAIYFDINTYGSALAYMIALVLRLGGGEPFLSVPAFINYPGNSATELNFPYKTLAMVTSFVTLLVFSYLARFLFTRGYLSEEYDVFDCRLASGGRTYYNKESPFATSIELEEDKTYPPKSGREKAPLS